MKILFVGLEPSPDILKTLGPTHTSFKAAKSINEVPDSADLVVVGIKTDSDFNLLLQLRQKFSGAWIVALVSQDSLESELFYNTLFNNSNKNEVWLKESWNKLFWFSLQTLTESLSHRNRAQELAQVSDHIVAQLKKNVDLATHLQRALLPKVTPTIPGISLMVKYLPSNGMGGDYYDIFEFSDKRHYGILLADSKTHGMAAALLSVLLKTRLEEVKSRFKSSTAFLEYIQKEIVAFTGGEKSELAVFFGVFDRQSLTLQFTSAGHLVPIILRKKEPLPFESHSTVPLGSSEKVAFQEVSLQLSQGDLVLFHTDGILAPLLNRGFTDLSHFLSQTHLSDPLDIQNEILGMVHELTLNSPLPDDLTLIQLSLKLVPVVLRLDGYRSP